MERGVMVTIKIVPRGSDDHRELVRSGWIPFESDIGPENVGLMEPIEGIMGRQSIASRERK